MDYRDPWNSWHEGNKITSNREAKYQLLADRIVCTNKSLCEDLSQRFGTEISKFSVIANGFIGDSNPSNNRLSSTCTFVYTGAISFAPDRTGYRDTAQIINALFSLKNEGITNLKFKFVGAANNNEAYVNNFKSYLADMVEIIPPVSTNEADKFIRESDICILLHTSNDNSGKFLISGKAYDYIREKKFILSIGNNDSQHARLVKELGIGINSLNDSKSLISSIKYCYELWREGRIYSVYDNIDTKSFSRNTQIQKYIKLIEEL